MEAIEEMDISTGIHALHGHINTWDVRSVTEMEEIFAQRNGFNQPLDKCNVTTMSCMFRECHHFNQSLDSWDVRNVTNMCEMFCLCFAFNQQLDTWNVNNVIAMSTGIPNQVFEFRRNSFLRR